MLKVFVLDGKFPWLTTGAAGFAWWTAAKVVIWIRPALWLLRLSGRTLKETFNFANLGLAFGYAVHKSRSVMGGMLAHFLKNLAPNA